MKNFKLFNEAEREAGYKMPKHVADAQKKFDAQSKQKKPAQAGTLAAKRNMKKEEVEQGVAGEKLNEMNPYLVQQGLGAVIDFLSKYPTATALTAGAVGAAAGGMIIKKLVTNAWQNHKELEQLKKDVLHWSSQKLHANKNVSRMGGKIAKIIQQEIARRKQNLPEQGVAEEVEQIDELTHMKSYKMAYLLKLIKDGEWEAYSDVKPRKHVTLTRLKDKKKVTVFVEEVQLGEVTAAQAAKILGGPVKKIPKGPPGKHPLGYRMARSAARRAMKAGMKKEETEDLEEMKHEKPIKDMSTSALKQYWSRHKDEQRPAPAFAAKLRQIAVELRRRKALNKESFDLQESHFKVGDKVECIRSGTTGVVTKVDPAGKGKYYTVKRSDGKEMKYAANELKKVMKEAKSSALAKARKDAMKAIKKDKDLAFKGDDDDVKASDDDVKAASKNPVMQLRRISDLDGKGDMEFKNGKKGKVTSAEAKALLKVFDTLRMPKEKEDFQNAIGKSLEDLKKVLRSPPKPSVPFKQKIKGSRYMTGFKWDNED